MVNVDVSPSVILGVGLIGAGVSLWQIRRVKPWISKDYDVVVSCISLLVGGILIFQGWRLDPLLLFGQLMTTGAAVSFGIEALKLRSQVFEAEEKAELQDVFRRKQSPPGGAGGAFELPPPEPMQQAPWQQQQQQYGGEPSQQWGTDAAQPPAWGAESWPPASSQAANARMSEEAGGSGYGAPWAYGSGEIDAEIVVADNYPTSSSPDYPTASSSPSGAAAQPEGQQQLDSSGLYDWGGGGMEPATGEAQTQPPDHGQGQQSRPRAGGFAGGTEDWD